MSRERYQRNMWDRFLQEGVEWKERVSGPPIECFLCRSRSVSGRVFELDADRDDTLSGLSGEFICTACWFQLWSRLTKIPDPGPSIPMEAILNAEYNKASQGIIDRFLAEAEGNQS